LEGHMIHGMNDGYDTSDGYSIACIIMLPTIYVI